MTEPAMPGVARRAIFAKSRRLWPDCKWTTKALPVARKYQVSLAFAGYSAECVCTTKLEAMETCFEAIRRIVE